MGRALRRACLPCSIGLNRVLRALLENRTFLPPSPAPPYQQAGTDLTSASGGRDHTTWPSATPTLVARSIHVHRIPPRIVMTRTPSTRGGSRRRFSEIWRMISGGGLLKEDMKAQPAWSKVSARTRTHRHPPHLTPADRTSTNRFQNRGELLLELLLLSRAWKIDKAAGVHHIEAVLRQSGLKDPAHVCFDQYQRNAAIRH